MSTLTTNGRPNEVNILVDAFWRAVSNHVDAQTDRELSVKAYEALAGYFNHQHSKTQKESFDLASKSIKRAVNENGQVFLQRQTLPPKIFHTGQAIAYYTMRNNCY